MHDPKSTFDCRRGSLDKSLRYLPAKSSESAIDTAFWHVAQQSLAD
jgi:hypothetical protein